MDEPTRAAVKRRVLFLLEEAKQKPPLRDIAVVFTQRSISNAYAVGTCKANPAMLKKKGRFRSRAAHELIEQLPVEEWLKSTVAEHQLPLVELWNRMCEQTEDTAWTDVVEWVEKWPVVTVTCREDAELRKVKRGECLGPDGHFDPDRRYSKAGIEVLERHDSEGSRVWRIRPASSSSDR